MHLSVSFPFSMVWQSRLYNLYYTVCQFDDEEEEGEEDLDLIGDETEFDDLEEDDEEVDGERRLVEAFGK